MPRDEPALIARLITLARRFGRYGSRRITALLRAEGWRVNHKRVERLWRQEGLRVLAKQPKRGRLWLADGSLVRRREYNQIRPHSALGSRPPAPETQEIGLPHPTPWAVRRIPVLT